MKVYWFYYKSLFLTAASFSLFLSLIDLGSSSVVVNITFDYYQLKKFIVIFSVAGFSLAALLNSYFYANKNYMYYNLGYSSRQLFMRTSGFNLLVMSIVCIIL